MAEINRITAISSLEKIFPEDSVQNKAVTHFSMLRNERFHFQIAVEAKKGRYNSRYN